MTDRILPGNLATQAYYSDLISFANQLPVNLLDFAQISNMRGRAYRVQGVDDPECWQRTTLNQCTRNHIWSQLIAVQQTLYGLNRFVAAPIYYSEVIPWERGMRVSTTLPFITDVNVAMDIEKLGSVSTSFFIQENLTLNDNGSFIEASVDSSLVANPRRMVFRESNTNENATWYQTHHQQDQNGYPYLDTGNWVVALGNTVGSAGVTLHGQTDIVTLSYQPPEAERGNWDAFVVLHPGSYQVLPMAKPITVVDEGTVDETWTIYLYAYTLKRPDYADEQSSLLTNNFDHFYDSVDYGFKRVTNQIGSLHYVDYDSWDIEIDGSTHETGNALVSIEDPLQGVLKVDEVALKESTTYTRMTPTHTQEPRWVRIYYKSDPGAFGQMGGSYEGLKYAICAKVAANLPVESCGLELLYAEREMDFIADMQQTFPTTIFTLTGAVDKYDPENKKGDREYEEFLSEAKQRRKVLRI